MQDLHGDPAEIQRLRTEEAGLIDRDARLSPGNAEIFYQLGLLRYTLGDYEKADVAFQKACELAPRSYDFRMALALLQEKRYDETGDERRYELAVESLKKLRDLNPDDIRGRQILQELMGIKQQKEVGKMPAESK